MNTSKLKILSQHESGFVSIRDGYDLIHLNFKNILLNFTAAEFVAFRRMTKSLLQHDCLIQFPDYSKRAILRTPFEGIMFSFNTAEINELTTILDEAYYVQEIYFLLNEQGL